MRKRRQKEEVANGAYVKTASVSLGASLPTVAGSLPGGIPTTVWFADDPGISGLLPSGIRKERELGSSAVVDTYACRSGHQCHRGAHFDSYAVAKNTDSTFQCPGMVCI